MSWFKNKNSTTDEVNEVVENVSDDQVSNETTSDISDNDSVDTQENQEAAVVEEIIKEDTPIIHNPSFEDAEKLVRERITWNRKWTKDIPNYLHSFHVRDILRVNRFDETIQMAWLLHDIVEDWNTSLDELRELWYSEEVVHLVDLSSHNLKVKDSFERWLLMMKRLEDACDRNAWAIKLADICDNVYLCHLMPNRDKKKRFLFEKCPYFVEQGNKWFWWTEFYLEFLRRYHTQLERFSEIERKRGFWFAWWLITRIAFIWAALVCFLWYKNNDVSIMALWFSIIVWLWIFMLIMHIICFRIPHKNIEY